MENGKVGTVDEAVQLAKEKLMGISLPAGLSRSVGLPINEAIDILQAVQDAWARDAAEEAKKAAQAKPGCLFPEESLPEPEEAEEEPEIVIEPITEEEAAESVD